MPERNKNRSMEVIFSNDKKFNNSIMSPSRPKISNSSFAQSPSICNFRNKRIKQNDFYTNRNNISMIGKNKANRSFMGSRKSGNKENKENRDNKNIKKIENKSEKKSNKKQIIIKNPKFKKQKF